MLVYQRVWFGFSLAIFWQSCFGIEVFFGPNDLRLRPVLTGQVEYHETGCFTTFERQRLYSGQKSTKMKMMMMMMLLLLLFFDKCWSFPGRETLPLLKLWNFRPANCCGLAQLIVRHGTASAWAAGTSARAGRWALEWKFWSLGPLKHGEGVLTPRDTKQGTVTTEMT